MGTTAEKLSYLNETKQAIKTAIQGKGVSVADSDTFRSYAQKIANIDTKPELSGNASNENVLENKTFYSNSYTKQTGTMKDRSGTTTMESTEVSLAPGFYDSTSKVTIDPNSKLNLTSDNIRNGVTILGYTGTLEPKPTLEGNATAAQVLSGKTFYSSDYDIQTGTMTNRGAMTRTIEPTTHTISIPKGYHNGSGKAVLPANFALMPITSSIDDITADDWGLYSWQELYLLRRLYTGTKVATKFLGQTKSLVVNGQSCTATLVDGTASGLTFYVTGMTTQYALFSGSSTSGGWASSAFRTTLNSTIYNTLPADLRNVIQPTTVSYGKGGGDRVTTIATSSDKLFVPSLKELKGNSNYIYNGTTYTNWQPDEGTQFAWFAQDVSRITPTSRTMTRSVPQSNRYCFIEANSTDANVIWLTTATSVAFCFNI